jgi:bifunctional non-homologous end joining protein LigD
LGVHSLPIGGDVPRPKRSPAKGTKATGRGQSAKQPAKAARKQPAGKAPLGSLPAKRGRSAASPLPEFIEFATCLLVDRPPNGPDWVHEIKLDGLRPQIRFEDGTATLRTRNGHDYSSTFPELARIARGFDNCIIDGEVCFVRTA